MILIHCFKLWRSLCIILLIVDKIKKMKTKNFALNFFNAFFRPSVTVSSLQRVDRLGDYGSMESLWSKDLNYDKKKLGIEPRPAQRGLKSLTLYRLHELVWVGVIVCVCENMFLRVFIFITCFYYETVRVCVWKHVFVYLVFVYLKISEICIRNLCTLLSIKNHI